MRIVITLGLAAATVASPMQAVAQTPASPPASAVQTGYSVDVTPIGTLLDNPATKAILDKHLPGMSANPQIDMARAMTLRAIAPYSPDMTDQVLTAIQADLARTPPPK